VAATIRQGGETVIDRLRNGYRDARLRRDLHRQSQAWRELGELRSTGFDRWKGRQDDPWHEYRARRAELVGRIAGLVERNPPLAAVARDLGLSDLDLVEVYRKLVRLTVRPWAVQPFHLPSALMLQPAWLEAVGALYLSGGLEAGAGSLEEALIAMDGTYPLRVLEPLVLSGRLVYGDHVA
jgi:hypothetical protein